MTLDPPEAHGESQETLQETDEEVSVEDEAGVDELVLLHVAGRAGQDVGFGLLVCECDGSGTIGETTDDNLDSVSFEVRILLSLFLP